MRVLAWNLQVKMNFVIFGIIGRTSQGLVWFCSPPTSRFSGASNMAGVVCFLVVITAFTAHAANEVQNIVSWMTGDARLLQGDMRQLMSEAKRNMPEMFRDAPEAIRAHGYPLETHKVRTEDGYILTMHRIPRGRAGGRGGWRGPVYLLHGIFGASDSWVIGGPGVAPAYFMADDGYDVWLGNSRGNYYSREHVNFTAKDKEFWRFSWNEMGMYDTPAMIDYVLKKTGQDKLIHVAHSMGNNIYYVMLSNKPEYVNKIRLKIDIAPSVFWDNMKAPIGKLIRDNHRLIKVIMDLQSTYELLRPSPARKAFYFFGCHKNSSQRKLCGSLFYASVGVSGVRDKNKLPIHLARMMESTSGPTMVHLAQNAKSGRFCQFDYGPQGNIKHYGTPYPPEYDLKKATAPTVLYTSTGDDLVPADGVVRLSQEIPNALELYWVPEKIFNHLDFLVHEETYDLLLHHMLKVMSKY